MIAPLLATLAAGLFAGAALYINLVEHPARLECGTRLAVTQFRPSYRRAAAMQGFLAAVGLLAGIVSGLRGHGLGWPLGGVVLGSVIPFTLLVVLPVNRKLQSERLDPESSAARALLSRWGRLHAVRTGLAVAAFLLFLWLLARA